MHRAHCRQLPPPSLLHHTTLLAFPLPYSRSINTTLSTSTFIRCRPCCKHALLIHRRFYYGTSACTLRRLHTTSTSSSSSSPLTSRIRQFIAKAHSTSSVYFTFLPVILNINPSNTPGPAPTDTLAAEPSTVVSASNSVASWIPSFHPVSLTSNALEWLHETTHTPWSATLILAALITRFCLLPIVLYNKRVAHNLSLLQQHLTYIRVLAARSPLPPLQKWLLRARTKWALYRRYHCHPIKLAIPAAIQLFILICVAMSIRPLLLVSPDVIHGGLAWFKNLSVMDPYYVLPLTAAALQYIHFQYREFIRTQRSGAATVSAVSNTRALPPAEALLRYLRTPFVRGAFPIILLPILSSLPAGFFVFQLTGSVWQLLQSVMLELPVVRHRLGLTIPNPSSVFIRRPGQTAAEEAEEHQELLRLISSKMQTAKVTLAVSTAAMQSALQSATASQSAAATPVIKPTVLWKGKRPVQQRTQTPLSKTVKQTVPSNSSGPSDAA